ncbi:MAG: dihydroorotate dehydrogenase (quinone) [Bacteroidetes bacterium]|nr:quinone-dependent dihydroorotate dehydrogenase [Flavobacteriaceae bacterium]PTM07308.1 MAG: dihydroorotate dehydrogenase (quinone) [Bacteroidota bacterium]
MYQFFIRPILFLFDAERAHHIAFRLLGIAEVLGFTRLYKSLFVSTSPLLKKEVMGIVFENPVGLAAGFDKDAKRYNSFGDLGFGFVEIGTLTPKAQPGNEKKRLFRLKKDAAIINRMGFNNNGVHVAVNRLRKSHRTIVGGNIGKNKITPNENAVEDYLYALKTLYPYVDYFVVNVSSPNTPGLRELQEKKPLEQLLSTLKLEGKNLAGVSAEKPILLKIAPDLTNHQLDDIIEIVENVKLEGVIATNTTIDRINLKSDQSLVSETGGLSGAPLRNRSTEVIKYLKEHQKSPFTIIGVGGIHSAEAAIEKIEAGADLIQLYTGFVYEGPKLISEIHRKLIDRA